MTPSARTHHRYSLLVLADVALPPEPFEELAPRVKSAVVGEVLTVVDDASAEGGDHDDESYPTAGGIGGAPPREKQRAVIRVGRVLYGTYREGDHVELLKPQSAYVLVPGMEGVFVADAEAVILGRYGPRTWSEADVLRGLAGAPTSGARR